MITDYNNISNKYKYTKTNPVKRYSEEFTFLQILGDINGKSVLDMACGDGYYSRLIKKLGAGQVTGVDISEKMIEKAQDIERQSPQGIEYIVKDVSKPESIGLFDVIVAIYLFTYAKNSNSLISMCQEISNNLKSNGKFYAVTLNTNLSEKHMLTSSHYDAKMTLQGTLKNASEIQIEIKTPYGGVNFSNYYWSRETYVKALTKSGFKKIIWHKALVSDDGINKYGKKYWQEHLNNPGFEIIECFKSNS